MNILREAGATELGLSASTLWAAELFEASRKEGEGRMASLARYVLGDRVNRRMDSRATWLIRAVERAYIAVRVPRPRGICRRAEPQRKTALNTAEASAAFVSQESRRQERPGQACSVPFSMLRANILRHARTVRGDCGDAARGVCRAAKRRPLETEMVVKRVVSHF